MIATTPTFLTQYPHDPPFGHAQGMNSVVKAGSCRRRVVVEDTVKVLVGVVEVEVVAQEKEATGKRRKITSQQAEER